MFAPNKAGAKYSRAAFLRDPETPVFVRFSTVAGGAGSVDLPRDVRGFATKFYTSEGVFDLLGTMMTTAMTTELQVQRDHGPGQGVPRPFGSGTRHGSTRSCTTTL